MARLILKVNLDPNSGKAPSMLPSKSLALTGQLIAPKGRYRLVGVDTFEGPLCDFLIGDFVSKDEAIAECSARATQPMMRYYVYSETGAMLFKAGKP